MTQFNIGDRVRHVGNQEWSKEWQDCVIISAPYGIKDYYDVRNNKGTEGAFFGKEMEMASPTPSTDRLVRLEAFVARVASGHPSSGFAWNDEAKALVDELNPVDPDIIEARNLVECTVHWSPQTDRDLQSGKNDDTPEMKIAIAAIKRGRELERGE